MSAEYTACSPTRGCCGPETLISGSSPGDTETYSVSRLLAPSSSVAIKETV
ncbi:hypothetical protein [Haladaptatus litoreus]|uniref:hypothetical protein n=1 Tax=Haladaptatus litoreus TaxID=553468 RepID=UPI001FE45136|nr:hypothetical protein [Haladaptatus litoreus]